MKKAVWKNVIQTLGAVAFLIVVWIVVWAAVGNELLVPSFTDCMREFFRAFADGGFWLAFWSTLLRVAIAFLSSFVLAAFFAVIAYLVPSFGRFFAPIVAVFRSVPVLAVLLIVLVWTGAGVAPIAVAFLSLFPMLYTAIFAALSQVDGALIEMSRIFNVPIKKQISSLYLPSVLPYVLRETGAALAFSLKLIVSAEVLARTAGSLGVLMQDAQILSQMPRLFALVLAVCLVGFIFELLFGLLARAMERRWK